MVSLKKNLLYNFLLSVSQVAFPLISIPYISRILDPSGIGRVSFIDSLTYYFIAIAEFGIIVYGIRETSRKKDDPVALNKLVSELVSLHIITSCISLLIYSIVVFLLYQKINDPRLVLFSISFLLVNFFASEWYFWGKERFKYIAIRSLIARTLGLISIFLLVKEPDDYYIYYSIIVFTSIINLTWNAIILFKENTISFKNINFKKHLPFTRVTYKISLVYGVVTVLDVVFLRMVSTAAAVAFYAFAAKLVRIAGALISDMLLVFYPRTVSLLHEKAENKLQQTVLNASDLIILTTIPLGVGLYFISENLTMAYFGAAFMPVAINLQILCMYPFIKAFSLFLNKQLLMAFDLEILVLKGLISGALIFVVSTLILSYYLADKGTSIAIMISEFAVLLYNIYYASKNNNLIKFFNKHTLWQAFIASIIFVPVLFLIDGLELSLLLKVMLQVVLCAIVYFIVISKLFKHSLVVQVISYFRVKEENV